MLTTEWSDWSNCNYYWIQSVYVRPESRHQGVFKELFDFAKTIAQSGVPVLFVSMSTATMLMPRKFTSRLVCMRAII